MLPVTGGDALAWARIGLVLVVAGSLAVLIRRRSARS